MELTKDNISDIIQNNKVCFSCGIIKPFSDYIEHNTSLDGYQNSCKKCHDNKIAYSPLIKSEFSIKDTTLDEKINYAWCAGFLDGEGCFSFLKVSKSHE